MSNLGRDMAQVLGVEDVLPRLAEIAVAGVGAARAKATLILGDGATRSAVWPADSAKDSFDAVLAIEDDSETVGEIAVAKGPGDALTPSDHKLLRDLAAQAAVALANARLAAELRARLDDIAVQADELKASRERIVSAADASRKRLEQDIAAGCELKLRALIAELEVVHESLGEGTVDVGVLFDRIAAQAAETLDELRNVARAIFPPLLADKGLVSAIEAYVAKLDGGVVLEVADGIHDARFERGIESAIYFCCIEGIQHVANYWRAKCAVVALEQVDGEVTFAITGDSGGWRKEEERSGPALTSMADRLAALGGGVEVTFEAGVGTTVTGRVPAGVMEVMG